MLPALTAQNQTRFGLEMHVSYLYINVNTEGSNTTLIFTIKKWSAVNQLKPVYLLDPLKLTQSNLCLWFLHFLSYFQHFTINMSSSVKL